MAKAVCQAVKNGEADRRGKPSIEWQKDGKPQYYCQGWISLATDELLETCRNCPDYVLQAEEDYEKYQEELRGGSSE